MLCSTFLIVHEKDDLYNFNFGGKLTNIFKDSYFQFLRLHYKTSGVRIGNYFERGIVMKKGETLKDLFYHRKTLYHKYRDLSINNSVLNINETSEIINYLL